MAADHSPLPWASDGRDITYEDNGDTCLLCEMYGSSENEYIRADRDFIVRCVNSHDALVSALRDAFAFVGFIYRQGGHAGLGNSAELMERIGGLLAAELAAKDEGVLQDLSERR